MNEKLRKDLKSLAADYEKNPAVALLAMRVLKELGTPEPTPTGETVRVRAGVYWDDTQKEWLVFGTLRRFQSGDTIITEIHDLELNGLICKQSDPKGNHYRLWVKTLVGSPIATIEAPIPLPRIPVVEARVVEGDQS